MKKEFSSWEKVCELREFKALRSLPSHPNVIALSEAFFMQQTRELYFVFEYMEINLYQFIKDRKGKLLKEHIVQSIIFQILEGLHHIHSYGIFHRDMKPENILISAKKKIICSCTNKSDSTCNSEQCQNSPWIEHIEAIQNIHKSDDSDSYIVKVGDFGLARDIKSKPPYTEYVSTRWYRAPEVLLRSNSYSSPIDLWAVGTIMAELFSLKPLFPGKSEIDQLFKISEVLGSPCIRSELSTQTDWIGGGEWKDGVKLAKSLGFTFSQTIPQPLSKILPPSTSPCFVEFIAQLLRYDPRQRLTALDALKHPYFVENNFIFVPPNEPENIKTISMEKKRKNGNFLPFRKNGGNLIPGDNKDANIYTWSKSKDTQNHDVNELYTSLLPLPLLNGYNSTSSRKFQFPSSHKSDRSNTASEIDRMVKDIEEINRGVNPIAVNCGSPRSVDLRGYQLPDDVMKFFGAADDSSPIIRRSCSRSKDFMKLHRRYSSTSATREEKLSLSFDLQHQKRTSVASSQDHSRNDSGFSTNSSNDLPEETIPSYVTKYYGQHLKTWQETCHENEDENETTVHKTLLNKDLSSVTNPTVPDFHIITYADVSGSESLQDYKSPEPSQTSNHSFFHNLKVAVKSHSASPTKRYGIFSKAWNRSKKP